jgi:hypothetical protein
MKFCIRYGSAKSTRGRTRLLCDEETRDRAFRANSVNTVDTEARDYVSPFAELAPEWYFLTESEPCALIARLGLGSQSLGGSPGASARKFVEGKSANDHARNIERLIKALMVRQRFHSFRHLRSCYSQSK